MELQIPQWCKQNGGILVLQLDFCPNCLTCVCPVKLLCLANQSRDGLHDFGIVFNIAMVKLSQTIEDLDICRLL
jgi:hypothetical protein